MLVLADDIFLPKKFRLNKNMNFTNTSIFIFPVNLSGSSVLVMNREFNRILPVRLTKET